MSIDTDIRTAASAGQKLAIQWGHEPWSDSWAELVAKTMLEAVCYRCGAGQPDDDEYFLAVGELAGGCERITHGRHCTCSACAREDWTNPDLAPCGMHGSDCPQLYRPWGPAGSYR